MGLEGSTRRFYTKVPYGFYEGSRKVLWDVESLGLVGAWGFGSERRCWFDLPHSWISLQCAAPGFALERFTGSPQGHDAHAQVQQDDTYVASYVEPN